MFHILERETEWRRQNGKAQGFGALRAFRPVVAVGAEDPLEDQKMLADYFRMHSAIVDRSDCPDINPGRWNGWPWWHPR